MQARPCSVAHWSSASRLGAFHVGLEAAEPDQTRDLVRRAAAPRSCDATRLRRPRSVFTFSSDTVNPNHLFAANPPQHHCADRNLRRPYRRRFALRPDRPYQLRLPAATLLRRGAVSFLLQIGPAVNRSDCFAASRLPKDITIVNSGSAARLAQTDAEPAVPHTRDRGNVTAAASADRADRRADPASGRRRSRRRRSRANSHRRRSQARS